MLIYSFKEPTNDKIIIPVTGSEKTKIELSENYLRIYRKTEQCAICYLIKEAMDKERPGCNLKK